MIKPGEIIEGRYFIEEHVGRGGMQEVYRANDKLLNIKVALKTPQPGQATKKFQKSAVIAAKVNHHNVAKTLDYIETGESVYLIEEFIKGETLDQKLERFGYLDPHLAAQVLHNLSKGLQASHRAGVIHRDLKPSNVMISGGVSFRDLKITDFGIATLTKEVFADAQRAGGLTNSTSGTVKGALPYMAPEMMFNTPEHPPGAPVDIWSLGAMMFRLLTGDYPFGVFLDAAVNVKNQTRKEWPKFMVSNPQFSPLAEDLKKIIDQCLSYDSTKRPTADELTKSCRELCYLSVEREEGQVENLIQNGYSGFAKGAEKSVFFSMESVYGSRKPNSDSHKNICYSSFPGTPKDRAHPVTVIKAK